MTDDFEQRLRDALRAAVPDPVDWPGRAAAARRRSRRARSTLWLSAVTAVVVIAAVVVPTVLTGEGSPRHLPSAGATHSAATPSTPPQNPPTVTCRGRLGASGQLSAVPDGAVAVRLCPGGLVPPTVGPRDILRTRIQKVVNVVNNLPKAPSDQACTDVKGGSYNLVFTYADGRTVVVHGSLVNCKDVTIGGAKRVGATKLLDAYLAAVQAQRAESAPPLLSPVHLSCPEDLDRALRSLILPTTHLHLTQAIACWRGDPAAQHAPVTLSARQVQRLNAGVAAHSVHVDNAATFHPSCPAVPWHSTRVVILGVNAWGDHVVLAQRDCGLFTINQHQVWSPSGSIGKLIRGNSTAVIHGRLLAAGMQEHPLRGTITLHGLQGAPTYGLPVHADGTFRSTVAPGRYQITGHSSSYHSGHAACRPANPVLAKGGATVKVDVYCPEK
ncbi:MAG: hypothetical protein ACRDQA_28115 [Nocardioidaceae bacterium]